MSYSQHTWKEHDPLGTPEAKAGWLDHIETQYSDACSYLDAYYHDTSYYLKAACDSKYFTAANDGTGSGLVCATIDTYTADDILSAGVPSGSICIWSGSVASIPSGYYLCNGSNGTPNLLNKFIVAAGGTYSKGATSSTATATPTASSVTIAAFALTEAHLPAHYHGYVDYYSNSGYYCTSYGGTAGPTGNHSGRWTDDDGASVAHNHTATFSGSACDTLPKYWALCYIMRG